MTNYKYTRIIFATLVLLCPAALFAQEKIMQPELMPMPAEIEFQPGKIQPG